MAVNLLFVIALSTLLLVLILILVSATLLCTLCGELNFVACLVVRSSSIVISVCDRASIALSSVGLDIKVSMASSSRSTWHNN